MSTMTFTSSGAKSSVTTILPKNIFGLKVENSDLLKQAYNAYLANGRTNNAITKTRGEVSGGGRKPWRQKGTGRARFGSTRNPIWRKGGVAFGPTGIENYSIEMPKAVRKQALRQALSLKATSDAIMVVEKLDIKDAKTKSALNLLTKIGIKGRTVIIVAELSEGLIKSVNNIPNVVVVKTGRLNTYQVMNADTILIVKDALSELEERLGSKK